MSLKPLYADNNPLARVCYVMGGKWRLQLFSQDVARRNAFNKENNHGQREYRATDPWENWSPLLDKDEAVKVLSRYRIEKKAGTMQSTESLT